MAYNQTFYIKIGDFVYLFFALYKKTLNFASKISIFVIIIIVNFGVK